VADFFGKLILPASYGDRRIEDAERFGPKQPSQQTELVRIRDEVVRTKRIRTVEGDSTGLSILDEYSDAVDSHAYRLQDLLPPLLRAQAVCPKVADELLLVAQKDSVVIRLAPARDEFS